MYHSLLLGRAIDQFFVPSPKNTLRIIASRSIGHRHRAPEHRVAEPRVLHRIDDTARRRFLPGGAAPLAAAPC